GVEENLIFRIGQRGFEIGAPAPNRVLPCQFLDLRRVAADQEWIGHQTRAIFERDAALIANCQDRADQVLVHAHAPGDAVHDDADALLGHSILLIAFQSGMALLANPGQSSDAIFKLPPRMRTRTAPWLRS